ncbi:MAG: type IV pilus assembly protein PilM [Planctomycetota bacterium]|jgi:type IV pilus assembly protein PilM
MFKRRNALVGLDIGTSEVKAIELTDFGDSIKVTGFGVGRIHDREELPEVIMSVLQEAGIRTKRVATSISGRSVIVRYLNLPMMEEDELKGALRYEADKYIPFEVDEVAIDGQKLEELANSAGDGELKALLVAAKKDLIQEHVSMIQDLGLTPVVVDVDVFALGNAFELRNSNSPRLEDENRITALVDMGATKTNINILKGNTSCFSREVYVGGNQLTEAIACDIHMDEAEAEELKRNPQGREGEIEGATTPVLDDLANEIHLSFDYFENQFDQQVGDIYVSGGGARSQGLAEVFERVFEREIHFWDPLENVEIAADKVDVELIRACANQLPIAVGLGARILDCS